MAGKRKDTSESEFLDALRAAEADVAQEFAPKVSRADTRRGERKKLLAAERRKKLEAQGVPFIRISDGRHRRACLGRNLYNEQCGLVPLKKGTELSVEGHDETYTATGGWCIFHDPELPDSFITAWKARARGGRKRHVGPDEYIREMVNRAVGLFVRPHLNALGVEIDKDTGEPRLVRGAGAKIYGESKDGDICMTDHDDVEAQQKAAERLFDRGFGRPRVQAELTMTPTGPAQQIPPTAERAHEVAQVLAEAGAIQHAEEQDTE